MIFEVCRIVVAICILIAQTSERMAELMDHDGQEILSTCIAEIVGVVDAASAIMLGIDEDDDMFVGCA